MHSMKSSDRALRFQVDRGHRVADEEFQRERFRIFKNLKEHNDEGYTPTFQTFGGRASSLAIRLNRRPVQPPPQGRLIGVDTQEARLTESDGIKVRFGDEASRDLIKNLPKSMDGVLKALGELKQIGVMSADQTRMIAERGRDDFSEALAVVVNVLMSRADSPEMVQNILDGKKADPDEGDEKGEESPELRFPPSRHKQALPDLPTINIIYKGVPSEIVTKPTWTAAREDIVSFIQSRGALVINMRTGNTVGMTTMRRLLGQKSNPFLLDIRNQRIIPATDLKNAFADRNKLQQLGKDRAERRRNRPLVEDAKQELEDLRDLQDRKERQKEIDQDFKDFADNL